jgi:glycosyltransferase involved in cell wall biosynthesis
MNIAIVDGDVSYPATSGKRLRTLNLMLCLAQRHRITYIGRCAEGSEEERLAPDFLNAHGINFSLVYDPVPQKSGLAFYARLALNLLSPFPYSVSSHQSVAMRNVIAAHAQKPIDLWQFEWAPYMTLVEGMIRSPRLVIAHNVDSLIWQRYYENEPNLLKKAFLEQQWRKFRRYEQDAFRRATRVVAVSVEDAQQIRSEFGQPAVDVVDNGIDRAYFEQAAGQRDPWRILFLGALDWRPNLDAVGLLLERIFPEVLAQEPRARLVLVGRHPPEALAHRIATMPQAELHADVADVRPFLAECGVMAVPLRIGGGSRLKILEALACGLPVVSTRVGAEGLNLQAGGDYVQAEETEMAAALVEAIRKPETAREQAQRGRRVVLENYDWGVLAKKLEASWEKCVAAPSAP